MTLLQTNAVTLTAPCTTCRHVEKIQGLTGLLLMNYDWTIAGQGTGLADGQLLADKRSNLITLSFHHFHSTLSVCEQLRAAVHSHLGLQPGAVVYTGSPCLEAT